MNTVEVVRLPFTLEDIVEALKKVDDEIRYWYEERGSAIDQIYLSWQQSRWLLDYKYKRLVVVCNSCTKFARECYEEKKTYLTTDKWIVELNIIHGVSLMCCGYCRLFP